MGKLDQNVKYYSLVDDVNSEGFTDDFICIDNVSFLFVFVLFYLFIRACKQKRFLLL